MKEAVLKIIITLTLIGMWCAILFTIMSNGCHDKMTVEERVAKCKELGFNDISVGLYDTYISVSCDKE